MPSKRTPNRKKRRAARLESGASGNSPLWPTAPMPAPTTSHRKMFLRALRWRIKLRHTVQDHRPLLLWLRGVGFVSLAAGSVGLMQVFFWPSVIAIYVGLAVLCLDILVVENFRAHIKAAVIACIIACGVGFTVKVVIHKSPIDFTYHVVDKRMEFFVSNASDDDDYRDFDIEVIPDSYEQMISLLSG